MTYSASTLSRLGVSSAWANGKGARRVLSAAGHPGYGEKFSRQVIALMGEREGRSVWSAIDMALHS